MPKFCWAFNTLLVILLVTNVHSTPYNGLFEVIFGKTSQQPIQKPVTKEFVFFSEKTEYGRRTTSVQKFVIPFDGMHFVSTRKLWSRFIAEYYEKMNIKNFNIEDDDLIFRKELYDELIDFILLYYFNSDFTSFNSARLVAQLTSVRDKPTWFYYDQFDFLNKCLQRFFMPNRVTFDGYRQFSDFPEIAHFDKTQFSEGRLRFSQYYGLLTKGIFVPNLIDDRRGGFLRNDPPYHRFDATDFNFPTPLNLDQFDKAKLVDEI